MVPFDPSYATFPLLVLLAVAIVAITPAVRRLVGQAADELGRLRAARLLSAGELAALEAFARSLGGSVEGTVEGDLHALLKLDGRRAWLDVTGAEPWMLSVAIEVDPGLDLEIRRPTFYKRPRGSARVSAVAAGDEQPDVRFDVRRAADERGDARERLFVHGGEGLTSPLAALLYHLGADLVLARNGRLGVTVGVRSLLVERARNLLAALAGVAAAYARRPALPDVGSLVERYLWLEGNAPRCPYCHVDLVEGEPGLTACDRCRTVHHEACFAEHGGCTLLGCGGRERAAPARALEGSP